MDTLQKKGFKEHLTLQRRVAVCEAASTLNKNQRQLKQLSEEQLQQSLSLMVDAKAELPLMILAGAVDAACARKMASITSGGAWTKASASHMNDFLAMWMPISLNDPNADFDVLKPRLHALVTKVMEASEPITVFGADSQAEQGEAAEDDEKDDPMGREQDKDKEPADEEQSLQVLPSDRVLIG